MKKKFKKELNKYSLWILIGTILPIIIYLFVFGANGLSLKNTNWSDFGSFIGGYGTLIFGAGNLYLLIKVSYQLNSIDEERNNQNKIDSVKPLGILSHEIDYKNLSYKVNINNLGLGPLIVQNYTLKYNETIYKTFNDFYNENTFYLNSINLPIKNNKFFVGANNHFTVFEITFNKVDLEEMKILNIRRNENFNDLLSKMKLVEFNFECEDLFKNKIELHIK
ncbi:hypothetical protein SAMN05443634_106165 [Chishuiella changwenlii]|uniref:Uncharacterized protein n=1 Tax=Chishuiella changwenlii TaxID=1434701 RepID=A0A1M6YBA8_9FLAO|nr:hypothetical protein [Chishuiella changwenlii]GGE97904.1 hypothetical protein GCM10010984_14330 [Chishuiella changwenlii]SHL15275.1 hypothetical protein SAMN05443634_106165 [Chishuiella changwenlii]